MAYQTDRLEWQAAASGLKPDGNPLVLDLLMTAGLNGPASDNTLEFIAETAGLLKIEEEDLRVISKLAASLLALDYQAFMDIHAKKFYNELGYLIPSEWIEKGRCHCGHYWNKEEAKATLKTRNDNTSYFTIINNAFFNILAIPGFITAQKRVEEKHYVHAGNSLVIFIFEQDKNSPQSRSDVSKYNIPSRVPISAKRDGFVQYVPQKDGSFDVWVTSAFDTLENLPAVKHEEKKEE